MTRVQRNLVAALVFLVGGVGAALYTMKTEVRTPDERFETEENAKRLFHFGRAHVRSGRLSAPSSTFAFTRDDVFGWTLTEPVRWPANGEAIEAMLDRMAGIKADPVVTESATPEDLERAGLTRPTITLQVNLDKGVQHTLHVGPRNKMVDKFPITDAAKTRLGLSEASFHWAMNRGLSEFRNDHIFPFQPGQIASVEIREGDEVHARLERPEGTGWKVSGAGLPAPIAGDDGAIGLLLAAITKRAKIDRYLDDAFVPTGTSAAHFGLDAPDLTVELTTKDGTTFTAQLAQFQETSDAQGTTVAHVPGTTTVVALRGGLMEALHRPASSYRDRTLSRFSPLVVTKVRLEIAGQPAIVLEKRATDWAMTAPQPGTAKVWRVEAIIRPFASLKVAEWRTESASKAELREWLLEPWSRRAIFYAEDGKVIADLRVGNLADDDHLLAKAADDARVGIIPATKLRAFPNSAGELIE